MQTLYRAVSRQEFDASRRYVRQSTPRAPSNVPYVVDNLWEWLRPAGAPSRRHAAYASPTPALALANASSAGSDRSEYVVCAVELEGDVRVAQLKVSDARHHPDLRRLQRLVLEVLGKDFHAASLPERCAVGPLFMPFMTKNDLQSLAHTAPDVQTIFDLAKDRSDFWATASAELDPESDGELFFELANGASYRLTPL